MIYIITAVVFGFVLIDIRMQLTRIANALERERQ
jgi:hypothetical protein